MLDMLLHVLRAFLCFVLMLTTQMLVSHIRMQFNLVVSSSRHAAAASSLCTQPPHSALALSLCTQLLHIVHGPAACAW